MRPIFTPIVRAWPGSTVVCLGTGPSLTAEDVNRCRLQLGVRVIAVNNAYQLAPWADALYAADENWWRRHNGVPGFQGLRVAIEPQRKVWPGMHVLRNTGKEGLELNPTGLRTGLNSGYQSLGLAVHLGAKKIGLLGFDMRHPAGQPTHFFGDHPSGRGTPSKFHAWIKAFETLAQPLNDLGIEVINCTPDSALKAFSMAPLSDVFHVEPVEASA